MMPTPMKAATVVKSQSRFLRPILAIKANGRIASNATGARNCARRSRRKAPTCSRKVSENMLLSVTFSYCPRVMACMKPSHVRG